MKAIQTRFLGPTNTRGARIKAYAEGGLNATVSKDYTSEEHDHDLAARALAEKMEWSGVYVRGGSADGRGFTYVNIGDDVKNAPGLLKDAFAFRIARKP